MLNRLLTRRGRLQPAAFATVTTSFFIVVAVAFWPSSTPSSAEMEMDMKPTAFPTHSSDIAKETAQMASLMKLQPGSTVCEVGGGNGSVLINLVPKVLPGGKYFGTGADQVEIDGMRKAAAEAGLSDAVSGLAVGIKLVSGLPSGSCDGLVLRMVYHMLPSPKEYLADFKAALKPGGLLLILEHNPDNGKKSRDGAVLQVGKDKVMNMPVVPQEALEKEATDAGFEVINSGLGVPPVADTSSYAFDWPYFKGKHYVHGDGRGYGLLLGVKPKPLCNCGCGGSGQCGASCSSCECDGCEAASPFPPPPTSPPPPKPLCNCACGGSGQCGLACELCDCEGCAAPSPPPPPKPLCNCQCGGSGQCGLACEFCDCEGCAPVKPVCNVACGSPKQCGAECSPCNCD